MGIDLRVVKCNGLIKILLSVGFQPGERSEKGEMSPEHGKGITEFEAEEEFHRRQHVQEKSAEHGALKMLYRKVFIKQV